MKPRKAIVLCFVTIAVCILGYEFFDPPVARFCSTVDDRIKYIFELITRLGLSTPWLVASLAGFICFKFIKKNEVLANAALFLFLAVALAGIANDLIKILVGRSRPGLLLHEGIYGFHPFTNQYKYASFPSGHANTIGALCYGLYRVIGRFKWVWLTVALAVMASRVIVGAHFPSDVIFGAFLGVVATELIAVAFEKKSRRITLQPGHGPVERAGKTDAV
jgi:undecaprenyl-diphosphatase